MVLFKSENIYNIVLLNIYKINCRLVFISNFNFYWHSFIVCMKKNCLFHQFNTYENVYFVISICILGNLFGHKHPRPDYEDLTF